MSNKQLSYAPAEFNLSWYGYAEIGMRQLQDKLKRQICLLCYDKAKSVEELSDSLQTEKAFIQDSVDSMVEAKLMKKIDDNYITAVPMIHLRDWKKVKNIQTELIWKLELPQKFDKLIWNLKGKIAKVDFYGNNFDIKYLNWIFYVMLNQAFEQQISLFYADKTDEIFVWKKDLRCTQNYNYSVCMFYKYADENLDKEFSIANLTENQKKTSEHSTNYNHINNINVINVYDAPPFPTAQWSNDGGTYDSKGGRNRYITNENISVYLNLVKGVYNNRDFTDVEKKVIKDFQNHGIVVEENGKYKPMIPVFTDETYQQVKAIFLKEVKSLVKEVVDQIGEKVESLLLPFLGDVKERKNHFYCFWISDFFSPMHEMFWYGLNQGGFALPKDYNKSVAGMYIVE